VAHLHRFLNHRFLNRNEVPPRGARAPAGSEGMSKPIRILRRRDVERRTGLSRSAIYQAMAERRFPKSIPLGPHSVGWIEDEVDGWINERIAARAAASK
jgi:prophage regulatory protein